MKTSTHRQRGIAAVAIAALIALTAACGGGDAEDEVDEDKTVAEMAEGNADLEPLIEAALEEGSVTLYSSQTQPGLDALVEGFEKRFPGIEVEALRQLENELGPRLESEKENGLADMVVSTNLATLDTVADQGGFVAPEHLSAVPEYDVDAWVTPSQYFEVGAAILVPVWNTGLLPDGISSLEDLLDPELEGRIGLPEPSAGAFVDMYLYLEDALGADGLEELAALKPKLYPSTTASGQAVVSGEISVTGFAPPPIADQEAGAPVDYEMPDEVWGNRYYGGVLGAAPHPNAAQLLAYYMATPQGQEEVQVGFASVYEDVPGTLGSTANVREQDERTFDPVFVSDFAARWSEMTG